jgi:hypothetical protein
MELEPIIKVIIGVVIFIAAALLSAYFHPGIKKRS